MMSRKKIIFVLIIVAMSALTVGLSAVGAQAVPTEATVVILTQTGCQFVEPEGIDYGFQSGSATDCKEINSRTAKQRLTEAKTLELVPGTYIFRLTNKNVSYELGFYLRGAGLGRLTLPKVAGGGLLPGTTKDYVIELKEGHYVYSCPLNPTPNYTLVVKSKA